MNKPYINSRIKLEQGCIRINRKILMCNLHMSKKIVWKYHPLNHIESKDGTFSLKLFVGALKANV